MPRWYPRVSPRLGRYFLPHGHDVGTPRILGKPKVRGLAPAWWHRAASAAESVQTRGPRTVKIVLATNIAETSITIDDIVVVIDSGKYKSKAYDPYTQMSSLQTVWVPQSSAKQRAGRAGRVRPGICFTLMSRSRHEASEPFAKAELLRTPLQEL